MIPSQHELRYFLEVANKLNLSRAAERLGISQPALSQAIQRIETCVGTSLLIRSKSGVKLTKSGLKLSMHARNLMTEWEKISQNILRDETEIRGQYSIGCHESVALYSLHHFLPELLKKYPNLNINLEHNLSRKIAEQVISFNIDFGIIVNPPQHPDLVIKELFLDEVTLWVSKNKHLKDVLIGHPELVQTQTIISQLKKKKIIFKRTMTSPSLEVITSLTAAGSGVGILPTRVATRIKSLGLKVFSSKAPKFYDKICLIYRADAQKSQACKKIISFISERLKNEKK